MRTLVRRAKALAVLLVLLGAVAVVFFVTNSGGETVFEGVGPDPTGMNTQFGCRYVSLEIEATYDAEHDVPESGPAVLNANLGTAGRIVNQKIVLLNFYETSQWFKQEFCAKPGSALSAHVKASFVWHELECYFRIGPNTETDSIVTAHGERRMTDTTTCAGAVP